jgi:two-component system, LytTR family, response regulator
MANQLINQYYQFTLCSCLKYDFMIQQEPLTKQLIVNLSEGTFYIDVHTIIRLEAKSNYTWIYLSNRSPLLSSCVLKTYDQQLQPYGFVRTHRSHLINRQHISSISNTGIVSLTEGSSIAVSKRKKSKVMKQLATA